MLFTARDEDGDLYDAAHLAQLIAALGPPPPEFLAKNPERKADFWNEHGMPTRSRTAVDLPFFLFALLS